MDGYIIAVGVLLCAFGQWFFSRRMLEKERIGRAMVLQVLSRLYGGQFVSECNWRHDQPACNDSTPLNKLCAPCFGRRVLEHEEKEPWSNCR